MNVKDKIIFGLLIVLLAAGGYFQWMADDMKTRMDVLNLQDQDHLDVIDKEFREDLKTLNLQFIGRGKHLRKAQKDIVDNTKLINHVSDSLGRNIETVALDLENFQRDTEQSFSKATKGRDGIASDLGSFKRQQRRFTGDLDQRLSTVETDVADLNERVPPKKVEKRP